MKSRAEVGVFGRKRAFGRTKRKLAVEFAVKNAIKREKRAKRAYHGGSEGNRGIRRTQETRKEGNVVGGDNGDTGLVTFDAQLLPRISASSPISRASEEDIDSEVFRRLDTQKSHVSYRNGK